MNKRAIAFLGFWLLLPLAVFSQTTEVHFSYDSNGNRTSRTLTVRKMEEKSMPADTSESQMFYGAISDALGQAMLSMFPNPAHDRLTVMLEGIEDEATASLITATGIVIRHCRLVNGTNDFNLVDLPPGTYLLRVSAPTVSQTWKIIKN